LKQKMAKFVRQNQGKVLYWNGLKTINAWNITFLIGSALPIPRMRKEAQRHFTMGNLLNNSRSHLYFYS